MLVAKPARGDCSAIVGTDFSGGRRRNQSIGSGAFFMPRLGCISWRCAVCFVAIRFCTGVLSKIRLENRVTLSIFKKAGRPGLFSAVLLAGLTLPSLVNAEGTSDISSRLDALQLQTGQLSQSLEALGAPSAGFGLTPPADIGGVVHVAQSSRDVAQLNLRLSALEEQVRALTGQVEGLTFQMTQYQTLIERMQEDIDFRFEQIDPSLGN